MIDIALAMVTDLSGLSTQGLADEYLVYTPHIGYGTHSRTLSGIQVPTSSTDCFRHLLKTYVFARY